MANDDESDQAAIDAIRARGPVWIPGAEALRLMEEALADAEARASLEDYRSRLATGRLVTVPHEEVRRRLGLG